MVTDCASTRGQFEQFDRKLTHYRSLAFLARLLGVFSPLFLDASATTSKINTCKIPLQPSSTHPQKQPGGGALSPRNSPVFIPFNFQLVHFPDLFTSQPSAGRLQFIKSGRRRAPIVCRVALTFRRDEGGHMMQYRTERRFWSPIFRARLLDLQPEPGRRFCNERHTGKE
jgi:hypothetical protein